MGKETESRQSQERTSEADVEDRPPNDAGPVQDLDRKEQPAKLEKPQEGVRELREARRWPWLTRTVVPAVLVSLSTGLGGYLLGDSLEARSRTEMRLKVMDRYFAADNDIPGERKQMLTFIERNLAKDDPVLRQWAKTEGAVVADHLARAEREVAELETEFRTLQAEVERQSQKCDERAAATDALLRENEEQPRAPRRHAAKELSPEVADPPGQLRQPQEEVHRESGEESRGVSFGF